MKFGFPLAAIRDLPVSTLCGCQNSKMMCRITPQAATQKYNPKPSQRHV